MAPSSTLSMSHVAVTPSLFASLGRPNASNRLSAKRSALAGTTDAINPRLRARSSSKLLGSVDTHVSSGGFTTGGSKCSNADPALLIQPCWKSSRPSSAGGAVRPRASAAAAAAAVFSKADTAGDLPRFSPGCSSKQQDPSTAVSMSTCADSNSTLEDNGGFSDPGQAHEVGSMPGTDNFERGCDAMTSRSMASTSASQSDFADCFDHCHGDLGSERGELVSGSSSTTPRPNSRKLTPPAAFLKRVLEGSGSSTSTHKGDASSKTRWSGLRSRRIVSNFGCRPSQGCIEPTNLEARHESQLPPVPLLNLAPECLAAASFTQPEVRGTTEELQPVAIDVELSDLARKIKEMEVECQALKESSGGLELTKDNDLADQGSDAAGQEAVGSNRTVEKACEEQSLPQPILEKVEEPILDKVEAPPDVPVLHLSPDDWRTSLKTLSGRCSQPEVFSEAPSQSALNAMDSLADLAKKIKDMDMVCQGLCDTDATVTSTEAVKKLDDLLPPQESMKSRKQSAAESRDLALKSAEKSALEAVKCPRLDMGARRAMWSAKTSAVGAVGKARSISQKRVRICEEVEKIDAEEAYSGYIEIVALNRLKEVEVETEVHNDVAAFDRACQGQAVSSLSRVDPNVAQEIPEVDSDILDDMAAFESVWQAQVSMEPSSDDQLSGATCAEDNGEAESLRDADENA